ncbi:conserved Plasmodium protein, unknown function [Plasmodium ovale curtisi]|uniref:Uncharacterized protein n=1 Tax=Plasmodium ovale curtisi TaxID=864141 RepID=A0A1A8VQC5_PLAOA|nr:conserved Plasmodium protein, unknown function [Plasmodium ovale curtisi]SBS81007.1 conserved Plasmodium protein, unknown function [Plasmodium ovale curtisi]
MSPRLSMEPIKILYLHIYEDSKTKKIRSLLEEIYGKDNVISSKDKSRTIDILILIFVYTLCLCCIANKLFEKLNPNVIVAYQFGCILAMHLSGPRVPMLLISPVQENFFSARVRKEVPIADFPYIIFVHSTLDRKRNLNKTLQLVESLDKEKYRVEIINEGYNLELLNKSDYKNWIDEVYAQSIQHMTTRSKSETTIDEDMFKPDA